jgi:CRISPR-associated protein Cas1
MLIIGCDFHTRLQQIAMMDTTTGELVERRLKHGNFASVEFDSASLSLPGRPYAMLSSPILTATVESRREQLLAYNDSRGFEFARLVVRGKIRNQRHVLLYFGKYLNQSDPARFESVSDVARRLRSLELQVRKLAGSSVGEKRQELMHSLCPSVGRCRKRRA